MNDVIGHSEWICPDIFYNMGQFFMLYTKSDFSEYR